MTDTMSDLNDNVGSSPTKAADISRAKARRSDLWVGWMGLAAALAVLPLPAQAHSPEIASVLAVGAIALLVGHRWGLGVIVAADILLVAAVWPLAFLHHPPSIPAQIAVVIACAGAIPGLLAWGRAARSLLDLIGLGGSDRAHRVTRVALALFAFALLVSPLL